MTSRTDFSQTWLVEMPSGTGKLTGPGMFTSLQHSISDYVSHGMAPSILTNGFKKIIGQQVAFYWHEANGEIDLAVELSIAPQALIVNGVATSPHGSTVHASDLYGLIINDSNKPLKLMSDEQLSDDGLKLWKRLLQLGHTVSVYDSRNPTDLQKLYSPDDLDKFIQFHSAEHRRYQYVLSEAGAQSAEVKSCFNTYRMRKIAGLTTE